MNDPILMAQVAKVVRAVAKIPKDIPVHADTRLVEDLGIDSLDLFAILVEIQDQSGEMIDVDEMPNFDKVADLAAYVTAQRIAAAA